MAASRERDLRGLENTLWEMRLQQKDTDLGIREMPAGLSVDTRPLGTHHAQASPSDSPNHDSPNHGKAG